MALFPGATATQTIYSEAFEEVKQNATISYALGSPLKAYGMDRGGHRGRRNEMERWDLTEPNGDEVSLVRFTVAGPQGAGIVTAQVPRSRRRGEFRYIVFEHRPSRKMLLVLDHRVNKEAQAVAPGPQGAERASKVPAPPPATAAAAS